MHKLCWNSLRRLCFDLGGCFFGGWVFCWVNYKKHNKEWGSRNQEKASAEIWGEFFRRNFPVNFVGDFSVDFCGLFPSAKKKQEENIHTKINSKIQVWNWEFRSQIHTARIWPWRISMTWKHPVLGKSWRTTFPWVSDVKMSLRLKLRTLKVPTP